jgi:type I restriction enzyme, S subunit
MSSDVKPLLLPLFASTIKANWSWERLDSIADVYDCPHSTPKLVDDPVEPFVVRSQDVRSGHIDLASVAHVSMDTYYDRIKRVEPRYGDLLYSREGTYFGIAAEVPKGIKMCLGQRMVLIRPDSSRIDHSFLRYWLNSPQVFGHIHGFRDGTVAERLNLPVIRGLAVAFPELEEQRLIAATLVALEARILLLRETNSTLEAIAQALFKSWFVDFDPVHANAGTQAPSLPPEIQALFPATFTDSLQGPIPEGWRIGSIYDIANITYGAPFASKQFNTEQRGLPLIRIRDLKDERPGVYTEEVHPKGYLTQPGDLVVGMDGEFRAYLWGGEPAWLNQRVCVFKPQIGYSTAFVNYTIKPQLAMVEATEIATTVIHLGKNDIDRFTALIPNESVQKAFSAVVTPIFDQIVEGKLKAQNLTKLRDTLLPRLISGQLRLPEAEQAIAAITD